LLRCKKLKNLENLGSDMVLVEIYKAQKTFKIWAAIWYLFWLKKLSEFGQRFGSCWD
jgi:hypothetical protein